MRIYTHIYTKSKAARIKRETGADVIGSEMEHPKDELKCFIRFIFRKQPTRASATISSGVAEVFT